MKLEPFLHVLPSLEYWRKKCDGNDCVSQIKSLNPVLEEKKAPNDLLIYIYIVRTVLIEHHLYERITANIRLE